MARARKACPTPGCPNPTNGGRCDTCTARADRARRPDGNPYTTRGHRNFRDVVLNRDPICTLCQLAPSTIADHHPTERRDLITLGLDPNDPQHGRGLCKACHDHKTATTTPGGWAAR